eukprot:Sspe_Gene.23986::Locus_9405_Transcript_4_5_Confidence_0.737_Length_897::g.23986::m.23986
MAWARYIFAAGVPFNHVAHPCFLEAINVTRPGIDAQAVMPSRHSLGTKYLDAVYEEVAAPMLADLDKAKYMTLQADGWKSDSDKIFAMVASVKGMPPFLLASKVTVVSWYLDVRKLADGAPVASGDESDS